ncbi:MAG: ABC transporter permease, partial [Candidatus Competibacterales bacterium]|nr:ABC transporter permease [Candidatus Competibacterales bacterium]
MLLRIAHLVLKELLALLRDPRSRIVVTLPPLVQTLIFGYAATFDLADVRYALLDRDGGPAARELAAAVSGSPTFHRVAALRDLAEARQLLERGEVLLVLHLEPRFSRELEASRSAPVQILVDGRNSNTAVTALRYMREIVSDFAAGHAATRDRPPPARPVVRAWFNPNLESRWFIVPGIVGLLTQVVVLLVTALSVAREREEGTFDQLLVTPLRPVEILLGKALP